LKWVEVLCEALVDLGTSEAHTNNQAYTRYSNVNNMQGTMQAMYDMDDNKNDALHKIKESKS